MDDILKRLTPEEIARLNAEFDSLTLANDFIFGATMEEYPDLCRRLIEIILDVKVKSIRYIEREKSLEERLDAKGVRLDVYVEDKDNDRSFNLEMQVANEYDLEKRLRYYQGMLDLDKLKRGRDYKHLGESYIIFICLFDYFKLGRRKYTFRETCEEVPELKLNDGTTKVVLNATGLRDGISDDLNGFLDYLMKRQSERSDLINELDLAVATVKTGVGRRLSFMTFEMRLNDARKEGRKEGREEGREEEREEERGRSNTRLSLLIHKLLADGKTQEIEEIAKDGRRIEELCTLYGIA